MYCEEYLNKDHGLIYCILKYDQYRMLLEQGVFCCSVLLYNELMHVYNGFLLLTGIQV